MRYYIDTCIWIDYWENRTDNLRPLGEFAANFFNNLDDDDIIYYSNFIIKELRNRYSDEIIAEIFKVVECKLLFIESNESHMRLAKIFSAAGLVHKSDALHIILAKEIGAKFITRDNQIILSGLIDASKPEDLI
ncbi:MAG: PIN domain-containing protein [Candidatus Woesearchaeota archaeon]